MCFLSRARGTWQLLPCCAHSLACESASVSTGSGCSAAALSSCPCSKDRSWFAGRHQRWLCWHAGGGTEVWMEARTGSISWCCQSGCILTCPLRDHVLPFIISAPISELLCLHRETVVVTSCWPAQSLPGTCTKGPAASFCSHCFQCTPAPRQPSCFCGSVAKLLHRGVSSACSSATVGLGTSPG